MITVYLNAISVIAPGIDNWANAKNILTRKQGYIHSKVTRKLPTMLAANENRRCSRTIQLALSSVQQLVEQYEFDSNETCYVFTSCNGDLSVFHHISTSLSQPGRPVSPTKFHNSVHNAPAGYCSISLKSQSPSTSICAYKDSFAAGLLEAAVQSLTRNMNCLLCGYDEVPPEPLLTLFPIEDDFSYALYLSPNKLNNNAKSLCRLDFDITKNQEISCMQEPEFELLRQSNPQAQILPLLSAIANKQDIALVFNNNQQQISIRLSELNED